MGVDKKSKGRIMNKKKALKKPEYPEVYPNSPLVEVICEIHFPSELAIECQRNRFHDVIRKQYPLLTLPGAEIMEARTARPYRFETVGRRRVVQLSINRFSYHEKQYKSHKDFIREFARLSKILAEIYTLDKLDRVGWRYINIIPFIREDGMVPLARFLNISIAACDGVFNKLENLSMVLITKVQNGSITTKIQSVIQSDSNQEAFLLDFDFAMTTGLSFSKLNAHVRKAHDYTRDLFEKLITDDYRQYLKGEAV